MNRPNILYIHSHDTGRCVSPYGYAVDTPNIHALANEGILFRNAFCAAPTCSPSRAGLLSGSSPHSCGILGLAHRGFRMQEDKHLVNFLKKAGYTAHLCGVQHETDNPRASGYDTIHWRIPRPSVGEGTASAFAEEFLDSKPQQPFFLSVGFTDTHRPYPALEPQDDTKYIQVPSCVPDLPETRSDWAAYRKSVKNLDNGMGVVLSALKRSGLMDSTIILCTTDHGIAFPRMKCNLTDAGMGVMLIVRWPERIQPGIVCDALVSQIDVFPTLCELLSLEPPNWLEGKSLLPLLDDPQHEINDEVFGEVTFHASYEPQRSIRTTRYKYIRRFGSRTELTRPNIDASPTKSVLLEAGFGRFEQVREQLYDLRLDPHEFRNLADDTGHKSVLDDLRTRLQDWMTRTNDPLLQGEVPLPAGARITDPNEPEPEGRMIVNEGNKP
ncbi:MAG TPA: sulfatase [bacterium]|nr:sulfatase [bacterium]